MRLPFVLFTCFLSVSSIAQTKMDLSKQIHSYMQTVAQKDGFTGTLVVTQHGRPVVHLGYGLANRLSNLSNGPETIHNLGSTGAIFTEMAIILLQERKKLSFSDPICNYLTDCPSSWKKITIQHLLDQKSGLNDYLLQPGIETQLGKKIEKKEMVAKFAADTLQFTPGEKFNSSATGYYLLGLIVEKVSGTSLASFVQKYVFEPLGMNKTRLLENGKVKNAAMGYIKEGDNLQPAPFVDPSLMFGYGNLYGTTGDLLLWEASLYNNKLMTFASQKQMAARTAAAGFGDKEAQMFGHNFYRYYKGTWGHRMHMLRFTHDSTVILLLTNNNTTKQDKYMRDIASMLYSTYVPSKEIVEVKVDSTILLRYVGNYVFAPGREVAITIVDGKLHMQGTGRPRRELVAVSDSKFYIKGGDVYLEFTNTGTVVNELVLHEINSTITALRKRD
jgi:CubicO group peptidase (beta-lactamase class C family)